jgi:hypothetical protein
VVWERIAVNREALYLTSVMPPRLLLRFSLIALSHQGWFPLGERAFDMAFLMLYTKTLSWRNGGHDCFSVSVSFLYLFLCSALLCSAVVVSLLPPLIISKHKQFFLSPISTNIHQNLSFASHIRPRV